MIIGAAGGSRIPTGIFWAIFNHMYLNKPLDEALGMRRLHHQLTPMSLQFETNFSPEILAILQNIYGHELLENKPDGGFAAVTGISVVDGEIFGSTDIRRGGSVEIF
jgi:gamma-glutamyltranspeptidase